MDTKHNQSAIAPQVVSGGGITGTRTTTVTETVSAQPVYPVPIAGGSSSNTNIVMILLFGLAIAALAVVIFTPSKREQQLADQNLQLNQANTDLKVRQQICADILRPQPETR